MKIRRDVRNRLHEKLIPPEPEGPVSAHGGHSGQFCCHAEDRLEDILSRYAGAGFSWVGISEHMPPVSDIFLYPDEREAGWTAASLVERFRLFVSTCRDLSQKFAHRLTVLTAMETEAYSGALDVARDLMDTLHLDYFVGSVHHVADIPIDVTGAQYRQAADHCGGLPELYAAYFDRQMDMLERLRPAVVGHFDLIRLFDPDYPARLTHPLVAPRIERNLTAIRDLGLLLDINGRALQKGASEPYVSAPLLRRAVELEIGLVPGDDSHSAGDAGRNLDRVADHIHRAGGRIHPHPPAGRNFNAAKPRVIP